MTTRLFLPLYLACYVLAAFVWRSFVVWKRTGINPVTFANTESAHDFIGRVLKLLFAIVSLIVLVFSVFPSAYKFTLPIVWLERTSLRLVGVILLLLSLIWTVIAQAQMADSWRIGIDTEHATPLVERGLFRVSRNPIFVGMLTTLLGLFLVIPNALTLIALVLGIVTIGIQVRLEEEFLRAVHSATYEEYCRRVRRWL